MIIDFSEQLPNYFISSHNFSFIGKTLHGEVDK